MHAPSGFQRLLAALGAGALACCLAFGAQAQDMGGDDGSDAAPPPGMFPIMPGEHITATLPPGWGVSSSRSTRQGSVTVNVIVMMPQQQPDDIENEQLVTVRMLGVTTKPAEYLAKIQKEEAAQCGKVVKSPIKSGLENGYPAVTLHRYCARDKRDNLCRTYVTKAIGGHDALYVLGYVRAYKCGDSENFSREEAQAWDRYMGAVMACDNSLHNCPGVLPPGQGAPGQSPDQQGPDQDGPDQDQQKPEPEPQIST